MTVVFATILLAPAGDCSGGECVPLTVSTALTVTCSPKGGATLGGLGVVSLWGRSTLFGGRDVLLAGMQSLLAVISSAFLRGLSHCSLLPDIPVCIRSSRLHSPSLVPVVAYFLPWPQSSSGRGNSSTTNTGMSGRGAALAPHPCIENPPSGVVPRSNFRTTVHLLRPMTAAF